MRRSLTFIFAIVLSTGIGSLWAQPAQSYVDSLVSRGDSLHRAYLFEDAIQAYLAAADSASSAQTLSLLEGRMALSQNALNMTDICADPHVVARQEFSRKDFFLFYPLKTQSWRSSPNILDSLEGHPTYFPKGETRIFYTAADNAGTRSIFYTEKGDSLWTAPHLLGESLTTTGDEIFPMLSPDGKTLYFSSNGLYGMGGYDLYSSSWDDENQTWQDPVNMGFPFNSPGDDFLLMDTEDGKYTIFASNRDCSSDSVYIYVLDYAESRTRKEVRSHEDIVRIASLIPANDPTRLDHGSISGESQIKENQNIRLYKRKNDEVRALMDSISLYRASSDTTRLKELETLLQDTLYEINIIAQTFLDDGVVTTSGEEEQEVVGEQLSYSFTRHGAGPKPRLKIRKAHRGNSYRVTPIGRVAPDATLPPGLVYQIQFATALRPLGVEALGGLSPVYRRLPPNLRYTYYVGVFDTYYEALAELNVVRNCGFPEAVIVAWKDGRQISLQQARQEEVRP